MLARLLFVALCLPIASVSLGQTRPISPSLPAYRQIKPASQEIYDYVNPRSTGNQYTDRFFNLFNYPNGTVTYVINGKIITKTSEVRAKVAERNMHIDSLSIGYPDANGKRLIRIRLLPNNL